METENKALDISDTSLKAIRSLRKDNPLRLQAEMVLADPDATIEDLQPIRQAFSNRSVRKRKDHRVAAWLIAYDNWTFSQRAIVTGKLCGLLDDAIGQKDPVRFALRWLGRGYLILFSITLFCAPLVVVMSTNQTYCFGRRERSRNRFNSLIVRSGADTCLR